MQFIFDSRYDSKADLAAGIAALTIYYERYHNEPLNGAPAITNVVKISDGLPRDVAERVQQQVARIVREEPSAAPAASAGFTPGAVSAPQPPAPPGIAGLTTPASSADVTGLPWDERIHAANKATNADGRWRKKKGLNDEAFIKRIEGELRAGVPGVVPPAPPAQAPAAPVAPPAPVQQAVAPVAPPVPPADPNVVATFEQLMAWVTPHMTTNRIPYNVVTGVVQEMGLNTLADLRGAVEMIPLVHAALQAKLPATQ